MDLWFTETHNGAGLTLKIKQSLFHDESPFQVVDVVETEAFGRMLLLDGLVMTTERDEYVYHEMITHVPLLSHPNPKRVLIIGGGDGGTLREVLKHPSVEEAVMVEIDGMVIDVCKQYLPSIACALDDPRANVIVGDGVAYMANEAKDFDVILIDSTDPIGPGEGLFTEEFYRNALNALTENGILTAQTENPFLNREIMTKVYGIYEKLFPIVRPYTGYIPTYPGAFWTWSFCSKGPEFRLDAAATARAKAIEATCQYYNHELHEACFVLPTYLRRVIEEKQAARQAVAANANAVG